MGDWRISELAGEESSRSSAASSSAWDSGNWWLHRHFHVPVAVWIVASVLGGAAIGSAVEPDRRADETPTTIEITSGEADAMACDTSDDVDLAGDVNRPSFAAGSAENVGDVNDAVADRNGVGCD